MMRANEIHTIVDWPSVLEQLGIPENVLRDEHGPCPACGGKDRFRFDNRRGRGDFYCNRCGSGDGFKLLQLTFGFTFSMARQKVLAVVGRLDRGGEPVRLVRAADPAHMAEKRPSPKPPERIYRLRRGRCAIENCSDAIDYLESRGLWPLPVGCSLKAHPTVEYWHDRRSIGRYPALIADVVDIEGELVTSHVTYLQAGRKLTGYEPRKILTGMTGRVGCAARLMPATEVLGIAEGLETALSAAVVHGIPVWAALNSSLLSRFEPPPGVTTLHVYGDRDEAGLLAALRVSERLQGRIRVESHIPKAPAKDWNDFLLNRAGR